MQNNTDRETMFALDANDNLSVHRFNKYRSYLMILFKELLELEIIEINPIRDLSKRKTIKKLRELLSDKEGERIDKYLKLNFYTFWRFMIIFFTQVQEEMRCWYYKRKTLMLRTPV